MDCQNKIRIEEMQESSISLGDVLGQYAFPDDQENEYVLTLPELDLNNQVRLLLTRHCFFARMLMLGITYDLDDFHAVSEKLLQIPHEMAGLLKNYYGSSMAGILENLLAGSSRTMLLFFTLHQNRSYELYEAGRQWDVNIENIARLLSDINPFYSFEEIDTLFQNLLELMKQEADLLFLGRHAEELQIFDKILNLVLAIADTLTNGIINQFPDAFF